MAMPTAALKQRPRRVQGALNSPYPEVGWGFLTVEQRQTMPREPICTLLVGKHSALMGYLAARLESEPGLGVQEVVPTTDTAIEFLRERPIHAVVLDWDSESRELNQALCLIKSAAPKVRVLLLAVSFEDRVVEAALQAGVAGLILKREVATCLAKALREVCAGGTVLPETIRSRLVVGPNGPELSP